MWWLDDERNTEHGGVAVTVAIMLMVLIGVGALVLDVGNLYWERRQLQNGADAAALALVQDCIEEGLPCTSVATTADTTGRTYADANAADGFAEAAVDLDPDTCRAEVNTSTLEADGGNLLPPFLAQVIVEGYEGTTVSARAVAVCGGIGQGSGLPLIFDDENWDEFEKVEKPEEAESDWWKNWEPGEEDEANDNVFFNQGDTGYGAGAFGWLDLDDGESCQATLYDLGLLDTNTGNSFSCEFHNASKQNADAFRDYVLENNPHLVPMYESYSGTGNNLTYTVSGFAVMYITGWHFSGEHYQYNAPCSGNERCISGHFLTKITLDEHPTGGGDFGVQTYSLTE